MVTKFYFSIFAIVLFNSLYLAAGSSNEDQCVTNGDLICMDCVTIGTCVDNGDGSFSVNAQSSCDSGQICIENVGTPACFRVTSSAAPKCMCDTPGTCASDPYDDASYVDCGNETTIFYGKCSEGDVYDNSTCSCEKDCPACGYFSANTGDCADYFSCTTGSNLAGRCPDGFCFDDVNCNCAEYCPVCGFIEDPTDPGGFFYCGDAPNGDRPGSCPDGYRFDQTSCSCVEGLPTTTAMPITTTKKPIACPSCGYAEYPDDPCNKYYQCNPDGTVTIQNCPAGLCYDVADCACDIPAFLWNSNH